MNIKRITKNTAVAAAVLVGSHFFAVGWHRVESFVGEQATIAKANAISLTAEKLGLEKKIEIDPLTAEELAEREAVPRGISPAVMRALFHFESRNKDKAISPKGAIGLGQVMPANAKRCGVEVWDLFRPDVNARCSAQILSEERETYRGNMFLALMAYHGGPMAVKQNWPVSQQYALNILNRAATDIR